MAFNNPEATYSNPSPYAISGKKGNVNLTPESQTATIFKMLAKIVIYTVISLTVIYFSIRILTPFIPFSYEEQLADRFLDDMFTPPRTRSKEEKALAVLQRLAENLASHMDMPDDLVVHVHLSPSREPNAFATLGGNLIITQGLIDHMESENALSMVIAHELAHLKNRDPLTSLGTGIVVSIVTSVIFGDDSVISGLTQLSFSRSQETKADEDGLKAVQAYYGHTFGAHEFFQFLWLEYERGAQSDFAEFFRTHPDTVKRLRMIRDSQQGPRQEITPLPQAIQAIQRQLPDRSNRNRNRR